MISAVHRITTSLGLYVWDVKKQNKTKQSVVNIAKGLERITQNWKRKLVFSGRYRQPKVSYPRDSYIQKSPHSFWKIQRSVLKSHISWMTWSGVKSELWPHGPQPPLRYAPTATWPLRVVVADYHLNERSPTRLFPALPYLESFKPDSLF